VSQATRWQCHASWPTRSARNHPEPGPPRPLGTGHDHANDHRPNRTKGPMSIDPRRIREASARAPRDRARACPNHDRRLVKAWHRSGARSTPRHGRRAARPPPGRRRRPAGGSARPDPNRRPGTSCTSRYGASVAARRLQDSRGTARLRAMMRAAEAPGTSSRSPRDDRRPGSRRNGRNAAQPAQTPSSGRHQPANRQGGVAGR